MKRLFAICLLMLSLSACTIDNACITIPPCPSDSTGHQQGKGNGGQ